MSLDKINTHSSIDNSYRSRLYLNLYLSEPLKSQTLEDIKKLNICYGYDIPALIISALRSSLSIKVKLIDKTSQSYVIFFNNGHIQNIEIADTDTRLGALLVQTGIISTVQLEQVLLSKPSAVPIGNYLIDKGLITKEQMGVVLVNQSRMRLSNLIGENLYQVEITENQNLMQTAELIPDQLKHLIHDWTLSKLSTEWLNAHYIEYFNFKIKVLWNSINISDLKNYTLLNLADENILDSIENLTLADLILKYENNKNIFKILHFLLLTQSICLVKENELGNNDLKIKHIYKLTMGKTGDHLITLLSQITKTDSLSLDDINEKIQKDFLTLDTHLNEFKLDISKRVLNLLLSSKKQTLELTQRNITKKQKEPKQQKVDLGPIKSLLLNKKYTEALTLVKNQKHLNSTHPTLQLYSAWAYMGLALFKKTDISISTLEKEFNDILPEDMTTADYYYVNYLLLKIKKQDQTAQSYLKKAIDLDPLVKSYPVESSFFDWF
ncbi:MAG: hypothetical protein ACK41T_01920 [Pseudobdellovibrio sp.]